VIAHREEHLDLCAASVLGSIGEADRVELERHLAGGCPVCERALAEFAQGAERLAATVPPLAPSPRLRERVLELARAEAAATARGRSAEPVATPGEARERATPGAGGVAGTGRAPSPAGGPGREPVAPRRVIELPARPRPAWPSWAFAAAAAVLAVSTFAAWRAADGLRGQLGAARDRIARIERELAEERAWAAVAASPGARVVELAPLPGGVALPRVRATYDPASRRAVIAFESLVTPAGSDFELWAILPDGPKSLGVVRPDASGRAEVRVPDAGDPAALAAFAVSLEREGGSTDPRKPGGPVVMAGTLKS
jgi:hypothetical protein